MYEFKTNKISRIDFLKLKENDLMFITNPGRMGDEDGSTFIIKNGNELTIYRVDGWMYPKVNEQEEYKISMDDVKKQFPKWHDAWKHGYEKDYEGKYKYLYMGFGNGLSVDKSIYSEFEVYLNVLVEEYLKDSSEEEKDNLRNAAIFNVWEKAFINMVNAKMYFLK